MTLTEDDLAAIKKMVGTMINDSNDSLEARLIARIDDLDDALSVQTERGLQEIRDQLAAVDGRLSGGIAAIKETVLRIDHVQQAELERDDRQDAAIHQIRESLHAA